jgi:hypothetical protein
MSLTLRANARLFLRLPSGPSPTIPQQIVLVHGNELLVRLSVRDPDSFRLSLCFSNVPTPLELLVEMISADNAYRFECSRRLFFSPDHLHFAICHPIPSDTQIFCCDVSIPTQLFAGLARFDNDRIGYLNSILQCVFHLPMLRKFIYSIDGQSSLWAHNLQLLFARMQFQGGRFHAYDLINSFYSSFSNEEIQARVLDFSDKKIAHDPFDFWLFLKNTLIAQTEIGDSFNELFLGQYTFHCFCEEVDDSAVFDGEAVDHVWLNVDGCLTLADSVAKFREQVRVIGCSQYGIPSSPGESYDLIRELNIAKLPSILFLGLRGVVRPSFSFPDAFDGSALLGEGDYALSGVIARSTTGNGHYIACLRTGKGGRIIVDLRINYRASLFQLQTTVTLTFSACFDCFQLRDPRRGLQSRPRSFLTHDTPINLKLNGELTFSL